MKYVVLALGSNLGDRYHNIEKAIQLLDLDSVQIGRMYENDALLAHDAPCEWNIPFINTVISGFTNLLPNELLKCCITVEKTLGRDDNGHKWSPRVIDIDIIMYDYDVINTHVLVVPHPLFHTRDFVLLPMSDHVPKNMIDFGININLSRMSDNDTLENKIAR